MWYALITFRIICFTEHNTRMGINTLVYLFLERLFSLELFVSKSRHLLQEMKAGCCTHLLFSCGQRQCTLSSELRKDCQTCTVHEDVYSARSYQTYLNVLSLTAKENIRSLISWLNNKHPVLRQLSTQHIISIVV